MQPLTPALLQQPLQHSPLSLQVLGRICGPENTRLHHRSCKVDLQAQNLLWWLLQHLGLHIKAEHKGQAALKAVLVEFGQVNMTALDQLLDTPLKYGSSG